MNMATTRHMLVTTRAVYSFPPESYTKANRIIMLADLNGLILSSSSLQMLINVRNSYDFHLTAYTSGARTELIKNMCEVYADLKIAEQPLLVVTHESAPDLSSLSVSPEMISMRNSLDSRLRIKRLSELVRCE